MKLVLASAPVKTLDVRFNIAAMMDAMRSIGGWADVLLFGESVLQGFDCLCWDYETDRQVAVELSDPAIRRMRDAAGQYRLAVSFGFIERMEDTLYSSQIFIGADGEILNVFRRVSVGWKEYRRTDEHYREGECFEKIRYRGKSFATGLCGDLWTDGGPEEMRSLNSDVVLWPVWCDYRADEWNGEIKYEYARQAARCGGCVLLVNPCCADADAHDAASGGAACFRGGRIASELPAGSSGMLTVEV